MMFAKAFGLCAAVAVAVVFLSASSATATVQSGALINLSTRAAVVDYLRSIHIDPRGVVIERGVRNYAGASCPGRGWTCTTTTHPVVQVAAAGGRNTFRCSTARCAVVQISNSQTSGTNTATCIKKKGLAQKCTIKQTSSTAHNKAVVYESVSSSKGTTTSTGSAMSITQTATSSVSITQKATGANSNEACVYQAISLARSGSIRKNTVKLTQSAHETVTIKQDSANGGNSAAESATPRGKCTGSSVTQRQTLSSDLTVPKSVTQKQNAASKGANMTIDIEQNQSAGFLGVADGHNSANFNQYGSQTALANSPAGPVTQTQSSLTGAVLGTLNQDSRDPSTASTTQTETQCVKAAKSGLTTCHASAVPGPFSVTQRQAGVVHKGVGVSKQTGNVADTFAVSQSLAQDNTPGPHSYQTNTVQGECSTAGNCTVSQKTDVNGQQSSNTKSGRGVNTVTNCTGNSCTSLSLARELTAHGAGGLIDTFDPTTGQLLNSFVPDGETGTQSGTGVAVGGNELFYTDLQNGNGPSDAIHVTPFNNGAGGHDTRTIPNPDPGKGIIALDYANGRLYVADNNDLVWALNPATGAVIGGPITLSSPDGNFVVLPNGNFLFSNGDCSYAEYDHVTGNPTGSVVTLPGTSLLSCDGVATDGASLYFAVINDDGSESVVWTGLDGTYFSNVPHVDSGDALNDISIP